MPPPNSFELYRGPRDEGVPVKLTNRAVLRHNLDFFNHYIFGDPIVAGSPL